MKRKSKLFMSIAFVMAVICLTCVQVLAQDPEGVSVPYAEDLLSISAEAPEGSYDPYADELMQGVVVRAKEIRENQLGYPANEDIQLGGFYQWYQENDIYRSMLNNAGDPNDFEADHGLLEIENRVIRFFAPFYGFDPDNVWGLVSASGTDGNNHGIYFGRHYLQSMTGMEPILYVSTESHYSNMRLAELQQIETCLIPTDKMGRMIPEEFRKALDPERPALVVYSMGTTFKDGVDDQQAINEILDEVNPPAVYRHVDAALFGGYLPFTEYREMVDRTVNRFDSIAISGHKFFGIDEPCGLFFTTKDVMAQQNPYEISYLNGSMPMINCSRSALNPLKFYWIIKNTGVKGFTEQAKDMLDNTAYLKARLDEISWPAWVSCGQSNTVFFERPAEEIMEKYYLAPDYDDRFGGELAHVVVMQTVTPDVIDDLIADLENLQTEDAAEIELDLELESIISEAAANDLLPSETFRTMLNENPEIELYMRESIGIAAEKNPDRKTNPVQSLEEIYDFIDYSVTRMPWNILPEERYSSFATKCDQSILYLYWLMDQPLTALEDRGLFYPSVEYLEPVYKWLTEYNNTWRDYLETTESWKPEYYEMLLKDPTWNLDKGWYESPENWQSFNAFFSRKLSGPEARPVADPEDDSVVAAPADSLPQGLWRIDEEGKFEADPITREDGVVIKDSCFITVEQLLGEEGSDYASLFHGGYLTHTYLNYDDYHRYHSPVSGTVREVYVIPYANAVGGIVYWDPETQLYVLESNSLSWQSVETRGVVLIETEYGMVALIPVGMGQVSSVNFVIEPGMEIKKGDEVGYFLFGGSDCVMLFEEKSGFTLTVEAGGEGSYSGGYAHVFCGEEYGRFAGK